MLSFLTPPRRYGTELLDDPGANAGLVLRTVSDITRSNTVFRGANAAVAEVARYFPQLSRRATLLDVGTGAGDVPERAMRAARARGISLETIGVDSEPLLALRARARVTHAVCASGLRLPFANRSVDVVMCSQTLHHFRGENASTLLREMTRVARVAVIVSDLRRSWIAAGGFWLMSFPLGFHAVTRHDGVVSVMRGFTVAELGDSVFDAVGVRPRVTRRLGFRVTTSWAPASCPQT
ncbi:MAG TPA: methyltransferase domain-containing protein [Candidatus Elarobacter sp.]|nr:methyltransferase domain-containing protein [Candidatus Elarobacter sp.]